MGLLKVEVIFTGVGEACDTGCGNTSMIVRDGRMCCLLDCGFSVPHQFFRFCSEPDELDYVWISHFHGDHFFGVPLLLLRFWEMGRRKSLRVIGPEGIASKIRAIMDLAYPNFSEKLQFDLVYTGLKPGDFLQIGGHYLQTARADHSQSCLALRLNDGKKSLFYSGDGRPTAETVQLAQGCDLVIHEAFMLHDEIPGHGSVQGCFDFCHEARVENLALVHLNRQVRKQHKAIEIMIRAEPDLHVFVPELDDIYKL